ncbi:N-acetylmuramoyl-L-alanine amidase [Romboutsia timonensis]|uniref:N-acetylmuramoyl-L-alanine amidase n=1 Tax=Romboutsia timonensis TaxID=1776391 RepID=UPI0008DA62D1|nr:N-acetylmuramoyl-L-alanine amidase [Romboutsia timonensis]
MKILISAGHTLTGKGTGAVGFINESQENRVLAKFIVEYLKKLGYEADYHEVNSGSDYINQQAKKANSKNYDLVVQIHFNRSDNATANGAEVIYRSSKGKVYAQRVQNKLKTEFKDRKIKHDINDLKRDLGWLRLTNPPAILIETCFVSNKSDTDKYTSNREKIAKLIAEGIADKTITENNNSSTSSIDKKLYAVCVTACEYENAKKMQQELINKGYKDTYLIPR